MSIVYKDLEWSEGSVNLPGIKRTVYYAAKRDLVGYPTLPESFVTNMGELVTYVGNYTLAALKTWRKLSCIVDKSPLDGKTQGTKPSKTFLNTVILQHESVDENASALAMQANNDDFVFLIPTKRGKYRVIGNDMYQTNVDVEQNLGGAPTDEMFTKLTVSVTDLAPGLFYEGEIVTVDGTINEQS